MDYKDYYKILGVARNAPANEIKRAYRKLARELHPDVNPGDKAAEARFKDINEAYEVLGDPEKRARYDQVGSSWQQWQRSGGDPSGFDWSQWFTAGGGQSPRSGVRVDMKDLNDLLGSGAAGGFSDFFNTLFGGMPQGRPGRTGRGRAPSQTVGSEPLQQTVDITLLEAFHGAVRTLERDGQRIQARIPAGSKTGTRIRLAGQGFPGADGRRGDLYLRVNVLPHHRLRVDGDDLHADHSLDLCTAVLGGDTIIETLDGTVSLRIPAGTQSGKVFRLRGKGMPRLNRPEERGDLYVRTTVTIPDSLSDQETELFKQLAALRKR
jgi:curved DNA-binding protein